MSLRIYLLLLALLLGKSAWAEKRATDYDFTVEQIFIDLDVPPNPKLNAVVDPKSYESNWAAVQFSQKISGDEAIEFNLPRYVEPDAIASINSLAANAWNSLLDCQSGDAAKARAAYATNNICSRARIPLAELKNSVALFLASAPTQSLKYGNKFKFTQSVMDQIEVPQFHPLLTQILLEEMAYGVLLPYGTWSCEGISCAVDVLFLDIPRRIILPAEAGRSSFWQIGFYIKDEELQRKKAAALGLLKKVISDEPLPVISGSDPVLEEIRKGYAAIHLLQIASLGRQECEAWGLWPLLSARLLNAVSSSSSYLNGALIESEESKELLNRMQSVCRFTLPEIRIHTGVDDWSVTGKHSLMALSEVGAWRQLHDIKRAN